MTTNANLIKYKKQQYDISRRNDLKLMSQEELKVYYAKCKKRYLHPQRFRIAKRNLDN